MRNKIIVPFILILIGVAIAGIAIFADLLGLDPSRGWGRTRIALLIFGTCMVVGAALFRRHVDATLNVMYRIQSFIGNQPVVLSIRRNQSVVYLSYLMENYWFTLPILVFVTLVYVWFISSGTGLTWVSPTHLYADLARGFLKGKLYLPIKVSSNLLNSPDPYNPSIGLGLQGPLDVSYFAGKYYLYWGPVPALILVLIHPIITWRLGDLQLVFGFVTGIYVLQCLLAVIIWDRFFKDLPRFILWLSVLLVGLASPATFILNNSKGARIYEAAITGGQFFLVSGFIVAITALVHPHSHWRLPLAGTLWVLAIGTRLILALPIGVMALMVAGWILWLNHWSLKKVTELIWLGLPLAFGIVGLGWYNWARFGSITETGYFYQMTAVPNLEQHYSELINPIFILQNLYNYLLYPFSIRSQFPYIYAEYGNVKAIFSSYILPSYYFSQQITGLVYTVPFLVFALVPPLAYFTKVLKKDAVQISLYNDERVFLNWITLTLGVAGLAVFSFLLAYYWAATRFLEDVMPVLIMLSIIGFWQGYQFFSNKLIGKRFYTAIGVILIVVTILASTLVAISVNDARFEVIRLFSPTR
jgi:hypothetical protein